MHSSPVTANYDYIKVTITKTNKYSTEKARFSTEKLHVSTEKMRVPRRNVRCVFPTCLAAFSDRTTEKFDFHRITTRSYGEGARFDILEIF